eukprot:351164_1
MYFRCCMVCGKLIKHFLHCMHIFQQGQWDSNLYYTQNIVYQNLLTSVNNNEMNTLLPIEYDMDIDDDNESMCSEITLLDSEYSDSDSYSVSGDDTDSDVNDDFDLDL